MRRQAARAGLLRRSAARHAARAVERARTDRAVAGDELARPPSGQGVERHVVDDDDEFADPFGVVGQNGAAERRILRQQPLERGDQREARRNMGFGDRFGERRLPARSRPSFFRSAPAALSRRPDPPAIDRASRAHASRFCC